MRNSLMSTSLLLVSTTLLVLFVIAQATAINGGSAEEEGIPQELVSKTFYPKRIFLDSQKSVTIIDADGSVITLTCDDIKVFFDTNPTDPVSVVIHVTEDLNYCNNMVVSLRELTELETRRLPSGQVSRILN